MRFLAAHWLFLLIGVALLAAAYIWVQVRGRRRAAVRFTNLELLASVAPRRPGWQRHVAAVLLLLSLLAMVVALARPTRSVRVARQRAIVVMAVDVSLSMEATDVEPSRLVAARRAAVEFVESLPDTVEIGLVTFAGTAAVTVTPTADHSQVIAALGSLRLREGTAIGEGVLASLDAIGSADNEDEVPASIVLLSDGETTVGTPTAEAAAVAGEAEVAVDTIAFGTDDGSVTVDGETVPVPVNRDELAGLADATGGRALTAETAGELAEAYGDVRTVVGYERTRKEATTAVLGGAIALAALAAVASLRWTGRLP